MFFDQKSQKKYTIKNGGFKKKKKKKESQLKVGGSFIVAFACECVQVWVRRKEGYSFDSSDHHVITLPSCEQLCRERERKRGRGGEGHQTNE
jgi:hypothetical protein